MATNYTALVAAWNSVTQPPVGVSGTALTGGMTTAQKIAAVNSWTVTGTIPTSFFTSGSAILNCINWSEFNALTAQQQSNVLAMCNNPGPLKGGSGDLTRMVPGMIIAYFPSGGPTILALSALASAQVQLWWQVSVANGGGGLTGPVDTNSAAAAGVS